MVEDFMCNLKVYRVAQGLTQEQLAEKVGVRRETIMSLEKAQNKQKIKHNYLLYKYLLLLLSHAYFRL